jgi:Matrixin
MRQLLALAAVLTAVLNSAAPAHAYLKLGAMVNGTVVDVTWRDPVRYFISERGASGVSAIEMRDAVARAAATWSAVESARVQFEFQGLTSAIPDVVDGRTTIGFLDRPDLAQVLGATSFMIDTETGAIVEADIFFNTAFQWSVTSAGTPGRVDLESVALHELGHLLGLSHSALGETELQASGNRRVTASGAVMFPIAMSSGTIAERVLHADDVAGVSDLYPMPSVIATTGAIVGRVTKNGQGLLGAHVLAFNPESGVLIANFTLNPQGEFVIARLPPGPYVLRVEPLDDANPESFFSIPIDADFRVTYAPRMVVAPEGGSSRSIEIQVLPK